ncbi:hypothetical protein TIFTF001_017192 [Ficus carica]|uniref:Uncharacterized protein n=1 Tax=Ficus carica TaxID=3494 RepID=A0AA88A8S8_FICCA|nr:hypothetical protein TIFTF001_017192 [Ficus carica]
MAMDRCPLPPPPVTPTSPGPASSPARNRLLPSGQPTPPPCPTGDQPPSPEIIFWRPLPLPTYAPPMAATLRPSTAIPSTSIAPHRP